VPALRTATKVLAVIVGMGAAGFAFLLARYEYDRYRLRDRLEHLDATLPSVRLVKDSCSPGATCQCHILTHRDVFSGCSIIDGVPALWIRSMDECFEQWLTVNRVWVPPDSLGERLGMLWIHSRPRVVSPGWSLLAVAPCLD